MSYRVTFPNDYTHMEIPSLDGFKMEQEFDDVVFGWFDDIYISVVKKEMKGYLEDRRPSANCDPYVVCQKLVETICGEI